jgi:AcrR family transcriptional regulator
MRHARIRAAAPVPRGRQRAPTPGSDEKRESILRVAEKLFHERGYADTKIEQIADALGVTKPYVYYYFRNKQQIFEQLSWRPTVACFTALDLPPDDLRPAHEKVAAAIETLIRVCVQHHPAAFLAYREPQAIGPKLRAAQLKLAHHFYDRMCTLLEEARREGTLHFNDTRLTALAACSIAGFMYSWYRPDGRLAPDEVVHELSQLAWRVIGLRRTRRRR